MASFRKIESFSRQMLILLSVFLTAELFVLYGNATYHDGLSMVAETEWVYDEDEKIVYQQAFAEEPADVYSKLLPQDYYLRATVG